ncbi:MAG: hypothetical protein M3Y44_06380, partial [Actinomycetota bacterium]|nr:hypothetical protein [Actinomycetota bacterium]
MTALAWLALAAALALVPLPSAAWHRAFGLSHRGRLAVIPSGTRRPVRLLPSPTSLRVAGGAGAAAGGYAVGGPALAAAAALLAATVAMLISAALARRHDSRRRRGLLAAIRLLVAELSAGSRPDAALD